MKCIFIDFRAGRCLPGSCYHMMSTVRFSSLIDYPAPEILRYPLQVIAVFALTHLPKARDKFNSIWTSENYERICLNKYKKISKFGFRAGTVITGA